MKEKKTIKKVAGVAQKANPLSTMTSKSHCDDIIEAEHVHERAHKDFYLSFPKVLKVYELPAPSITCGI